MDDWSAQDFARFFEALWSTPEEPRKPFQWQMDLAQRVLEGGNSPWPEAISLATGSGKTACIDIALFALAAQAGRLQKGEVIQAPRRIFFVVDRRIIVDEASRRAKHIAAKLADAKQGILFEAAEALRAIAQGDGADHTDKLPLGVHVMRGGAYRSDAWAKDPLQPVVVASTVDQFGSRLLFRAYGGSPGMWPVYAGLTANESLVFLDEAHCSQPFMQTLHGVRRYRNWAKQNLQRPFHPVILSATPPQGVKNHFFDDSDQGRDPTHPLGARQLACKPATLLEVKKAKGKKALDHLAKAMADATQDLLASTPGESFPQHPALAVFVNRVATARSVHAQLRKKGLDAILVTGRMRPVDKARLQKELLEKLDLSSGRSARRCLDGPKIVVTTQALEVGADLDFDALVTECASLDALRQRFGRLNRMGRGINASARILIRADQVKQSTDDPIYGQAISHTWAWLQDQTDEQQQVDFGIHAMNAALPETEARRSMESPARDAPVMLPAHIDAWAQTAPVPVPSPDISLFLHGVQQASTDVQVCFRADLHDDQAELNGERVSVCPPTTTECLAVPIAVFRRWMLESDSAKGEWQDDTGDLEGVVSPDAEPEAKGQDLPAKPKRVYRWRAGEGLEVIDRANRLHPGDVLMVPASLACWQGLGDLPDAATENLLGLDVAEQGYRMARAKNLLRLHPTLVEAWPEGAAKQAAQALLMGDGTVSEPLSTRFDLEPEAVAEQVQQVLEHLKCLTGVAQETQVSPLSDLAMVAAKLLEEFSRRGLRSAVRIMGEHDLVVVGRRLDPELTAQAEVFGDESDLNSSGISRRSGRPVPLAEHLPGVQSFARRFAQGSGLDRKLVHVLSQSGLLHDLGKADPRFQKMLRAGHPLAFGPVLAKSATLPTSPARRAQVAEASGYPRGWRHELLSVRMAESVPGLLPEESGHRDLALHLIASHHGHCRPFAPVVNDEAEAEVVFEIEGQQAKWTGAHGLERLDSGVADRFWQLSHELGWWGLAWMEALMRLADHRRSEWEEGHD